MIQPEFNLLDTIEQVQLLNEQGVYIGKRRAGNCIAVLYQVEGFYVEIQYNKYRLHISRINSSTSTDLLSPYLDQLKIELLLHVEDRVN